MLSRPAEALQAYKMLLYFNPSDTEIARMVFELEALAYEKGSVVLQTDFKIATAQSAMGSSPQVATDRDRHRWVKRIETLQNLLLKVQRYRLTPISTRDSN